MNNEDQIKPLEDDGEVVPQSEALASLSEVGAHMFRGSRAMNHKERSTFNMLMAKQSKRLNCQPATPPTT
jgi:hypothetical protein